MFERIELLNVARPFTTELKVEQLYSILKGNYKEMEVGGIQEKLWLKERALVANPWV